MILNTRRIMPQYQFPHTCFLGDSSGIGGRGMLHHSAALRHRLQERGLMKQGSDTFDNRNYFLTILRVRTIRIAFGSHMVETAVFLLHTMCLLEQETACRYAVLERNGLHADRAVLIDYLMLARVDMMKNNVVQPIVGMVVKQRLQQFFQIRMCIDMHRLRTFEHAQCRQQADKTETMVAMQMGNENIIQPPGMNAEFLHCQKHSFTTIHQKGLVA